MPLTVRNAGLNTLIGNEKGTEGILLLLNVAQERDWPQHAFGEDRTFNRSRERQDPLLDDRREAEEHHDLGHPGAGDAFPAGDLGLVGDSPGVEFPPPGDGLAEQLDHIRAFSAPWAALAAEGGSEAAGRRIRPGRRAPGASGRRYCRSRTPLRPERDLDRLFAQVYATLCVVGGYVDDAEPDLRHRPPELTEGKPGSH